jgi:hypothetical protein
MQTFRVWGWVTVVAVGWLATESEAANKAAKRTEHPVARSAQDVAAEVDRLILTELDRARQPVAPIAGDEDFLRRVSFDIAGTPPTPRDVTLFGLNPDPEKRVKVADQLLASPNYGKNWGSYWRDVVFLPATNMRARGANAVFEQWMVEQLNANRKWDQIVTDMLTATGNVGENGATGLIFAHSAEPPEVAAEACRIFLGIQIQCANCHDHPSDVWKREQFHELAAYFPRAALRPVIVDGQQRGFEVVSVNQSRRGGPGGMMPENVERQFALLDRNRDGQIDQREAENSPGGMFARVFERTLLVADINKDKKLSLEEMKGMPAPQLAGRGNAEYYMPDLKDPASRGQLVQPKFFVDESQPGAGLSDEDRRQAAAKAFTDIDNPWFSRAVINRVWNEMLGEGFSMPVDDMGPTRNARYPQALDALAEGFIGSGYDLKWLVKTVVLTQAYQRQVRAKPVSETALPFAAQTPTHLRSDQLYNALATVLGFSEPSAPPLGRGPGGIYGGNRGPRSQFNAIFTFDPSTPQEDITGNVQQALLMMNTPMFRGAIAASGNSRLAQILRTQTDDQDAISEVYLLALSREPSDRELKLCQQYIMDTNNRPEAFEDLLWGLLNSSEFVSKR